MLMDDRGSRYITVSWFEHALGDYSERYPQCLSENCITGMKQKGEKQTVLVIGSPHVALMPNLPWEMYGHYHTQDIRISLEAVVNCCQLIFLPTVKLHSPRQQNSKSSDINLAEDRNLGLQICKLCPQTPVIWCLCHHLILDGIRQKRAHFSPGIYTQQGLFCLHLKNHHF